MLFATFLGFVLVLYIGAFCHVVYSIFKLKTKFSPIWLWVVFLLPVLGPILYLSVKKSRKDYSLF
jgi:hypothetical protein